MNATTTHVQRMLERCRNARSMGYVFEISRNDKTPQGGEKLPYSVNLYMEKNGQRMKPWLSLFECRSDQEARNAITAAVEGWRTGSFTVTTAEE